MGNRMTRPAIIAVLDFIWKRPRNVAPMTSSPSVATSSTGRQASHSPQSGPVLDPYDLGHTITDHITQTWADQMERARKLDERAEIVAALKKEGL